MRQISGINTEENEKKDKLSNLHAQSHRQYCFISPYVRLYTVAGKAVPINQLFLSVAYITFTNIYNKMDKYIIIEITITIVPTLTYIYLSQTCLFHL